MSYWIARTLARRRMRASIHERRMAELMDVDVRTIKRWEAGEGFGRKTELDRAVAGYAYVLGLDDGRELWEEALEWWRAEGSPPEFMLEEGPAAAFAEAIRLQALRQRAQIPGRSQDGAARPSARASTTRRAKAR